MDNKKTKKELIEELNRLRALLKKQSSASGSPDSGPSTESWFKAMAESVPAAIFAVRDKKIVYVNHAVAETVGYSKEELIGRSFWDIIAPDHRELVRQKAPLPVLDESLPTRYEVKVRTRDGKDLWIDFMAGVVEIGGTRVILGTAVEITSRKKAESALRESEHRFRGTFEQAAVGIAQVSTTGQWLRANQRLCETFGYTREELFDLTFQKITHPDDLQPNMSLFKEALAGRRDRYQMEKRYVRKDGSTLWANLTVSLVKDESNKPMYFISVIEDITERKRAEEALWRSEEKHRNLFQNSMVGMFRSSLNSGTILEANGAVRRIFGYERTENIKAVDLYFNLQDRDRMKERLIKRGSVENFETRMKRKDGSEIWVSYSAQLFREEGYLEGVVVDITERRKVQDELLKQKKIESIGILAGGIAHDFNNILSAVVGNITLSRLRLKAGDGEASEERLQEAEKAIMRAKNLTHQLLTFSQGGTPIRKISSIGDLIRDSVTFVLRGSNVRCVFDLSSELWQAEIDEGQINQVINNLVINAKQAMPAGGELKVRAHNVILGEEKPYGIDEGDGRFIKVSFEDHGAGIPARDLQKIFDPYFTTKEKGSGLGLATSYSIIKGHGGIITVESDAGRGSTFSVFLPATNAAEEATVETKKPPTKKALNILLMDDEPAILDALSAMIGELGHSTTLTKDATEAIEQYKDALLRKKRFNLVIMDLTIPGGMGGAEAIKVLKELDPDVCAIASSGYSNSPVMASYADHGFVGVLPKPYNMDALEEVITRVKHCES